MDGRMDNGQQALSNEHGISYLLDKHLFGVSAPASHQVGAAVSQTLSGDLDKEL